MFGSDVDMDFFLDKKLMSTAGRALIVFPLGPKGDAEVIGALGFIDILESLV